LFNNIISEVENRVHLLVQKNVQVN